MKKASIAAESRQDFGSARCRRLRREGYIPAVVYGGTSAPQPLRVKAKDAAEMVKQGRRMVDLETPAGAQKVFVREVQYDATGDRILHIDFHQVALDEILTLEVPLEVTGKPVGVTADGGVLDHYVKRVSVRCLPAAIPDKLTADVSHLKLNDHLLVKELKAPEGVTLATSADIVVAAVRLPLVEALTPAAAEPGPTEPELIGKKPAEEGEAAEEAEAKPAKAAKAAEDEKGEKEKKK